MSEKLLRKLIKEMIETDAPPQASGRNDAVKQVVASWLEKFGGDVSDQRGLRYDLDDFAKYIHYFTREPSTNLSTIEDHLDNNFDLKPEALRDLSTALYTFAQAEFDKRFQ